MNQEIKIANHDGQEYTLDQLKDMVLSSNEGEYSFDEALDGDLATSSSIISNLIKYIESNQVAPKIPVLMTKDNPTGWKLEELLEQISTEIVAKDKTLLSMHDNYPENIKAIHDINVNIVIALTQCINLQNKALCLLEAIRTPELNK